MYDADKVITGVIVFAIVITSPVWYSAISHKAHYMPDPKIVTTEKQCVESKQYMIDNHARMLNDWRWQVVRNDNRTYVATDGKKYEMSLEDTCMKCHSNKKDFCDQCHNYAGVNPNCFDCHNAPKEE